LVGILEALDCLELVIDIADAQVVVVLMGGPLPAHADLRSVLSRAADGAFDLIGVHAPDGDGSIPAVMEDWATGGYYPADTDKLRAALCDGEEGWFDPAGELRPEPKTKRECVKSNC
jgi:hypothetical protein